MSDGARAPRCWAVIPAAGSGQRMGTEEPKQYMQLAGATVLEHALKPFLDHPRIEGVVVVLAADDSRWETLACASHSAIVRARGGKKRADSVLNGLEALSSRAHADDWVLVHDAARPCLARGDLDRLIGGLYDDSVGGLLATPLGDTLKRSDAAAEVVVGTLDRDGLWRAQTPQMFRYGILRRALTAANAAGSAVTDEAAAIEAMGLTPKLIEGPPTNIKITRPDDLTMAQAILNINKQQPGREKAMTQKIGTGYDVHAFAPGDHVMLGGVRIPHTHGVRAHSDGDVIIHALCDALLGAAGLGDIGQHFPDTDSRWRGAASSVFLHHVTELLALRSYRIVNIDVTLLAERPRIGPHRDAIRKMLAELLKIPAEAVNIKATTAEGLGAIGRGEGVAAQAAVSIETQRS